MEIQNHETEDEAILLQLANPLVELILMNQSPSSQILTKNMQIEQILSDIWHFPNVF